MNYYWSKYDFYDRIDELNRIKNNKSESEKAKIDSCIELILEDIKEIEGKEDIKLPYLVRIKKDIIKFDGIPSIVDDIRTFSCGEEFHNQKHTYNYLPLTKKDVLQITHDFYKSQNKKIFMKFLDFYNERKNHLLFINGHNPDNNITYFIPYFNEAFMSLSKSNSIFTLYSAIHEFAHAISFNFNPNALLFDFNKRIFLEIESIFFELVAGDYLSQNVNSGDEYNELISNHSLFLNEAIYLTDRIQIAKLVKENDIYSNKTLKALCDSELNFANFYVDQLMGQQTYEVLPYIISYLFAVELYELYKYDKEKALHTLEKIMLLREESTLKYYQELKKLGLIPNSHMNDFFTDLKDKVL